MAAPQLGAQETQEDKILKTEKEKISYVIGVNAVRNFESRGDDFDLEMVIRGLRDAYSGKKLLLSEKECNEILDAYRKKQLLKQIEATKNAGEKNKKEGDAFLEQNKAREGIVTLPSGLQYKIIKEGDGKKPVDGETVQVHYRGTLIDGTEFDSSYKRGEPASFEIGKVIPGWTEALKLMPVGSRWRLFIPPDLAYGDKGAGNAIGPNTTLVFEVELLAIEKNSE
jgi:FKBP-type peptidyl-prolyl cis-trans isomerase FklB